MSTILTDLPPIFPTSSSTPAQSSAILTNPTSLSSAVSLSSARSGSASSSISASSSAPSSTDAPPPQTQPPDPGTSIRLTTSGNSVITITSVVQASQSSSAAAASSTTAPKTFFQNTAEMAGVFSVVGIIGVILIFIFVTNAVRRRRAKQFDREVAEAAAAAAAAQLPVFDDEDDAYAGGSKFTQYSENSHGTFAQPPMTHAGAGDGYGMSEVMYPYDPFGSPLGAGAAGVGVGASMQRARSRKDLRADIIGASSMPGYDAGGGAMPGYGEHASPYPAFPMYNSAPTGGAGPSYSGTGAAAVNDLMDAAGLGVTRGPSQRLPNSGYVDPSARSWSPPGAGNGVGQDPAAQGESYAARYQPGYQHESPSPPAMSGPIELTDNDAYGGAVVESQTNSRKSDSPHSRNSSEHSDGEAYGGELQAVDSRASFADELDYELERGKRVLKVTNA